MEIALIAAVAFLASILTFFSGFGLGTLLTPVFVLFFPIDIAIALTGVVHFFNNLFKLFLVGRNANRRVLLRFGVPAVLAALAGSWLLVYISDLPPLFSYELSGRIMEVFPVQFIVAILLLVFACMDLIPAAARIQFSEDKLPLGGILSGFFGGLSGHQGALRSAFLIRAGLSKEAFIGTTVVVSCFVDLTRLGVYSSRFRETGLGDNVEILSVAILSAILGAYLGNRLLKKVTLGFLKTSVAIMLIVISLALGAGFL